MRCLETAATRVGRGQNPWNCFSSRREAIYSQEAWRAGDGRGKAQWAIDPYSVIVHNGARRSCAWKLVMFDWLSVQQISQVFGHRQTDNAVDHAFRRRICAFPTSWVMPLDKPTQCTSTLCHHLPQLSLLKDCKPIREALRECGSVRGRE